MPNSCSTEPAGVIELFESPDIHTVKESFKKIEDLLDSTRRITSSEEIARWASIAITQCQIASMCAVRALTGGK